MSSLLLVVQPHPILSSCLMPQNRKKSAQNCGSYVQPAAGGPAAPNPVQLADAPKQEETFPKLWFLYYVSSCLLETLARKLKILKNEF